MQDLITKLFQKIVLNKDIRKFKNNYFYYVFFRLVRKMLNSKIEIKIHDFKILASNKKNIASHAILRKCDFTDYPEKKLIKEISRNNDIFLIDCGSNFGFYSLFVASLSPSNKIISLEASPKTYNDHKENILLNNFKNIQLYNLAVSDVENENLNLNESENDWESSISRNDLNKTQITKVKTTTIDSLSDENNFKNFDLIIKLDVEGYEFHSISGADKTIINNNPLIIIEFSKFMQNNKKYSFSFLSQFLKNYDYSIYNHRFKKTFTDKIVTQLNNLSDSHFTIGNLFLVKNGSKFERLILSMN